MKLEGKSYSLAAIFNYTRVSFWKWYDCIHYHMLFHKKCYIFIVVL